MICFRLIDLKDPAQPLADAVHALAQGAATQDTYAVDPVSFRHVPNAPFAYWVSDTIRKLFTTLPPFENEERTAKVGLQTSDDFRFVRCSWETTITPEELTHRNWYHFAKGGSYSPFYTDIHLKVNWADRGFELNAWQNGKYPYLNGNAHKMLHTDQENYLRPGLTWTNSTTSELSLRALPKQCVFGHMGPSAFFKFSNFISIIGMMHSKVVAALIKMQLGLAAAGRKNYEVGIINRTPLPDLEESISNDLTTYSQTAWNQKRRPDTANANSHAFVAPALAPQKTHLS